MPICRRWFSFSTVRSYSTVVIGSYLAFRKSLPAVGADTAPGQVVGIALPFLIKGLVPVAVRTVVGPQAPAFVVDCVKERGFGFKRAVSFVVGGLNHFFPGQSCFLREESGTSTGEAGHKVFALAS